MIMEQQQADPTSVTRACTLSKQSCHNMDTHGEPAEAKQSGINAYRSALKYGVTWQVRDSGRLLLSLPCLVCLYHAVSDSQDAATCCAMHPAPELHHLI